MLSGGAVLLDAGSVRARHTDSATPASSSLPSARDCTASTGTLLWVPLRAMVSPSAHLGFLALRRVLAQSRFGRVLGHVGSHTATPNQAVELTPSARHAGCFARGLALAPVTPRCGGSSPWGR